MAGENQAPRRREERRRRTRLTRPAVLNYVGSSDGPKPAQRLAQQSTLPNAEQYQADDFFGQASSTMGTSMLPGGSDFTDDGSLPCFSNASTSGVSESVASSQGERDMNTRTRFLVEDQDGGLHPAPLAPLRNLELAPQLLQCPFKFLRCNLEFAIDNVQEWYEHSLTHFTVGEERPRTARPPSPTQCCFCDKTFEDPDGMTCWRERMHHVAWHHHAGCSLAHARHDFALVEHLWREGILDKADYRELKTLPRERPRSVQNIPTPPDSASESGAVTVVNEERSRAPN